MWQRIIQFLATFEIYIAADLDMQVQQVEEGPIDMASFLHDSELLKQSEYKMKQDVAIQAVAPTEEFSKLGSWIW